MIYTTLYVTIFYACRSLAWVCGRGLVPGNLEFFGTKWHSPIGSMPNHMTQKTLDFPRDQTPPTCPRNGFALIINITVKRPYFDTLFSENSVFL
jgi:hypothetical protein